MSDIKMIKNNMSKSRTVETRLIKSTSKRQITIPKSFFNFLALENGVSFIANLFDNGIFLIPQVQTEETVWDEDRKQIIRNLLRERLPEEEFVHELNYRLKKYDEFLSNRVKEFNADILEDDAGLDDTLGAGNFNGLEIFFDS